MPPAKVAPSVTSAVVTSTEWTVKRSGSRFGHHLGLATVKSVKAAMNWSAGTSVKTENPMVGIMVTSDTK